MRPGILDILPVSVHFYKGKTPTLSYSPVGVSFSTREKHSLRWAYRGVMMILVIFAHNVQFLDENG